MLVHQQTVLLRRLVLVLGVTPGDCRVAGEANNARTLAHFEGPVSLEQPRMAMQDFTHNRIAGR